MNCQPYRNSVLAGIGLLVYPFVSIAGLPLRVEAVPSRTALQVSSRSSQVVFNPPRGGAPRSTVSGGTRDGGICSQSLTSPQPGFTPILPDQQEGMTVSERPTFIAYVPPTTAQTVFFSLKGEEEDYYYQTTFSLTAGARIVSFALPADAPPLQVGKSYRWSLVLVCNGRLRPDDPLIAGWVTRSELSSALADRLKQESDLQKAATYGEAGIWLDMMAVLMELRRADPSNVQLTQMWQSLLSDHGMESIASAPIE